jgi:hypothetical protein
MKKLSIVSLMLALSAGCATGPVDVSEGDQTALIKGFGAIGGGCSVHAQPEQNEPVQGKGTRELTVDAGRITIVARCGHPGAYSSPDSLTPFEFTAEAGHTYEFRNQRRGPNCLELVDLTDHTRAVACKPYSFGGYRNLSTGAHTAFLNGAGKYLKCRFSSVDQEWRRYEVLQIDPGKIAVNVRCDLGTFFRQYDGQAHFNFNAEAGHEYAFSKSDEDCIQLVDLTVDGSVVVCEIYQEIGLLDIFR